MDEIPLVAVYTNRVGYLESEPPLLDLAYENILHYQLRSDRMNTLHIAGVPIPIWIGLTEEGEVTIGSAHGVRLPPGGDAKYLEPQGSSLEATEKELQSIERRMAILGLSMLMSDKGHTPETATSKRIDKSESDSQLATAARALQDGLEEALRLHAKWLGLPDGGSVIVNTDFVQEPLDPQVVRVISEMVSLGQLSIDTMWDILVRGEVLPTGFDSELEQDRLMSLGSMERVIPMPKREA